MKNEEQPYELKYQPEILQQKKLYENELLNLKHQLQTTQLELQSCKNEIAAMETSKFWKLRTIWFWIKNNNSLIKKIFAFFYKRIVQKIMSKYLKNQSQQYINNSLSDDNNYNIWLNKNFPKKADLIKMGEISSILPYKPLISIIMPVFNTPESVLMPAIESVINQVYSHWELCIADDASTQPHIKLILNEYVAKYPQIKVIFREKNGHISAASNSALELATGEFIALLDHDDLLTPDALYEVVLLLNTNPQADMIYSDEDKINEKGKLQEHFFKPDWSPEYSRGVMYVGHLLCLRKDLAIAFGGFNTEYDGVQNYELMLRISEKTKKIEHIPKIIYHWRKIPGSIAADINAKPNIEALQIKAVDAHLQRIGLPAKAQAGQGNHRVKIVPLLKQDYPLISIIIPTKDAPTYLEKCLKSIFTLSKYPNYEIILVDNQTTDTKALQIMAEFPVKRIEFPDPFNYSRANNLGSNLAQGEYLVFLNNDTEVLTKDWLEYLLYYAEQPDIGAVGSLLLFPDKTVQHAGVVMGFRGTADHVMRGFSINVDGYAGSLVCAREVSAVTAACMMMKKSDFEQIGKFNEHFFTHYQDVDLCMRLVQNNKKIIFTPHSVLIHHESKTRKSYYDMVDRMLLLDQWQDYIDRGDPFYNLNFDTKYDNYTVKT